MLTLIHRKPGHVYRFRFNQADEDAFLRDVIGSLVAGGEFSQQDGLVMIARVHAIGRDRAEHRCAWLERENVRLHKQLRRLSWRRKAMKWLRIWEGVS